MCEQTWPQCWGNGEPQRTGIAMPWWFTFISLGLSAFIVQRQWPTHRHNDCLNAMVHHTPLEGTHCQYNKALQSLSTCCLSTSLQCADLAQLLLALACCCLSSVSLQRAHHNAESLCSLVEALLLQVIMMLLSLALCWQGPTKSLIFCCCCSHAIIAMVL